MTTEEAAARITALEGTKLGLEMKVRALEARIAELEAMVDADTQEMANTLKFANDRVKRAEARFQAEGRVNDHLNTRVGELDGALDILSKANQECNDALVAAEARAEHYRATLGYIYAQAELGYRTVLSVIKANAKAALDDEWQTTVAAARRGIKAERDG